MNVLLSLLTGGNGIFIGIAAVIAAIAGAWLKGRSSGANAERDKQLKRDAAAMSEAQRIDQAVAGNDPDENRKELGKWSR